MRNSEFVLDDPPLFDHDDTQLHHMSNVRLQFPFTSSSDVTNTMLEHLDASILGALEGKSKLPITMTDYSLMHPSPIEINERLLGFSGVCFRHLMNNLCSYSTGANYLEIGVFKGSTLISSVYGNEAVLNEVHAIDNFSEFVPGDAGTHGTYPHPKDELQKNMNMFLPNTKDKIQLHEADCFQFDLSKLPKIDIYFYDGEHSAESQYKAFKYYEPAFADIFIAVIDDWAQGGVRRGTKKAFAEIDYDVIASRAIIPGKRPNGASRVDNPCRYWWCGTHLALLKKRGS